MKRTKIFSTVGLVALLLSLVGLYVNSSKDTFRAVEAAKPPLPPATSPAANIEPPVSDTAPEKLVQHDASEVDPYSELPEHIQRAIKYAESVPKAESIDRVVNSSRDSSAEMKKKFEDMGQAEEFRYLRSRIEDYSAFYNSDVIGEGAVQKKAVRNALRDNLAIFMTSRGLDQARVEKLESLNYNVVEGGERAIVSKGDVKDYIALSEEAKFGLDDHGRECLFFTSNNLKKFRENVNGSGSDVSFSPICASDRGFESFGNSLRPDRIYDKNELQNLIKKFNR